MRVDYEWVFIGIYVQKRSLMMLHVEHESDFYESYESRTKLLLGFSCRILIKRRRRA